MPTNKKWIIDTNILVHWLMVSQILEFSIKKFHLHSEFLETYKNRYEESISFINKILNITEVKHDFVIVELSLNELFSGVRDEVRSILLFVKGIPISRWASKRETKEVSFPPEMSEEIYKLTSLGIDSMLANKKIAIIHTTSPSDENNYLEVYSSLIFLYPDLKTQDAILITTGIFEKTDYFVTKDDALLNLRKEIGEQYGMEIVRPQRASQILVQRTR